MSDNLFIITVSFDPVFNPDKAKVFQEFTAEDSRLLYTALLLNHTDVFKSYSPAHQEIYFLHEDDKEFIPEEISSSGIQIAYINSEKGWNGIIEKLSSIFGKGGAQILLFSINSIGFSPADIEKFFGFMSHDDKNILIVRKKDGIICLGMNYPGLNIFEGLENKNFSYDDLLPNVNKTHNFLFEIEDFLHIDDMNDFKELYDVLSKKESAVFCSNESHDRFTNLFIEYKDKL